MKPAQPHRPIRWPFWLLIAAWFCANSPQAATYALLTWLADARTFTHQHRLTADVAELLGGGGARETAVAAASAPERENPVPLVPPEAVLKKIQLSMEGLAEVLPPALRANRPAAVAGVCADSRRAAPPHEPPRVTAA